MLWDLRDKVALVTGSAHRVGRTIALGLAKEGVHLLVHYHSATDDQVRDTLRDIKSEGVDAFSIQADLSQAESIQSILDSINEHFGKLDILVNSASTFQKRTLNEVTLDEWNLTMNVNLRAPFLLTQHIAPLMQDNKDGGVIINILDRGADSPWADYAHHGISKAGLKALTEVSAVSLGPKVRVNAVVPGPVMKPAGREMTDEAWAEVGKLNPLQITGKADDVAQAVTYLTKGTFLTGAIIHVNAGEHLA